MVSSSFLIMLFYMHILDEPWCFINSDINIANLIFCNSLLSIMSCSSSCLSLRTSVSDTGISFSTAIDEYYVKLSDAAAYAFKSGLIQQTADDFRSALRRTPLHDVICIASHVYECSYSIRQNGATKEPHAHVLWYQRNYSSGTTKLMQDFFNTRKLRGEFLNYFF